MDTTFILLHAMEEFMTQTTVAKLQTYQGNLCRVILKIKKYVFKQKKGPKSCDLYATESGHVNKSPNAIRDTSC